MEAINTRFAEALDFIKVNFGDKQTEVANKLELNKTAISRYKSSTKPPPTIVHKLASLYKINAGYVLDGVGKISDVTNSNVNYLIKLRTEKNLTQSELADKLGLHQSRLSLLEKESSLPDKVANKIIEVFGVELSDIYPERYQKAEPLQDFPVNSNYLKDNSAEPIINPNILFVPLVSKFAHAGFLSGYGDDEYIETLPKYPFFSEDSNPKGTYRGFEVRGDSMDDGTSESIQDGAIVLGREIQRHHWTNKFHLHRWKYYLVVHETEGILIKQITEHDTDKGFIRLHSLNDMYSDIVIPLDECKQIYNVIQSVKKQ
jgi:transcriptional regulator with XRE-family HTH domain